MDKIRITALVIASMGIIVSSVMLIRTYNEYRVASIEYEDLNKYTMDITEDEAPKDVEALVVEEDVKVLARNYNRNDFPDFSVDFEGLYKENNDYIGWLYVGSCEISYPVVQGDDNDYYLHNTFEKEANFAGCIFIDFQDEPDFSRFNTFVYGHAMKNGTMFGSLKKLRKDENNLKNDPYIYMYLKDGIYRYKIYSYYIDKKDSEMYNSADTEEQYRKYLRAALDKSMVDCEVEPSVEDNSITLVTCQGTGSNKQRFFVHGTFVDRYLFE